MQTKEKNRYKDFIENLHLFGIDKNVDPAFCDEQTIREFQEAKQRYKVIAKKLPSYNTDENIDPVFYGEEVVLLFERTKKLYEQIINNSPLFDTDKNADPVLYNEKKLLLFENVSEYCKLFVFLPEKFEQICLEIMETLNECIKYFDKNQGIFLHYFNTALKRKTNASQAVERNEERQSGMKVKTGTNKKIREVVRFANMHGLDLTDNETQRKIAMAFGWSLRETEEIVDLWHKTLVLKDRMFSPDEDDDESGSWQDVADTNQFSPERLFVNENMHDEMLDMTEKTFDSLQQRQKPILSMLLTANLLAEAEIEDSVLKQKSFFSQQILDYVNNTHQIPSSKWIANEFGVSEPSISRTYKMFRQKLFVNLAKQFCMQYKKAEGCLPSAFTVAQRFNVTSNDSYIKIINEVLKQTD